MRFIGDLHGDMQTYLDLVHGQPSSIQVGDFGVGFGALDFSKVPGFADHRFIRGNHDNPFDLGRYGCHIADGCTTDDGWFFMGGARTITKARRGKPWWPEEEIGDAELQPIYEHYRKVKPRVVVTHEAPISAAQRMFEAEGSMIEMLQPYKTNMLLEKMLECHQPELWVFGHYHETVTDVFGSTRFVCVGKGDKFDYSLGGSYND